MGTYDQWKTRSPDDELYRGLRYSDEEFEEAMNDRDFIEDQERDERVREAAHEMLAALKDCRDYFETHERATYWPMCDAIIRKAEGK